MKIEVKKTKVFRQSAMQGNQVDVLIRGKYEFFPGFWPLVDENHEVTNLIAVGNKNGVPEELLQRFKKEYGNEFTYIYCCQSGYTLTNRKYMLNELFDGIFGLDYITYKDKHLNCNHSMMVRSFPYEGLFWKHEGTKSFDFNMLTIPKIGSFSKRWDRGELIARNLCRRGFRGAVYSQTKKSEELATEVLTLYIKNNSLVIRDGGLSSLDFHKEACKSLVTIFPNNKDAFPKFIIESLLADRFVVISDDLLLGRNVLNRLGEPYVTEIRFNNYEDYDKVACLIRNVKGSRYNGLSPRKEWLDRYNFKKISQYWAKEFNRVYGRVFKQLYYMNHVPRINKCLMLGMSETYFFGE
jgi:hypothetical protein